MLAEDLIMFRKADLTTLHHIMIALQLFYDCSGLTANLYKSQIVLGGCSSELEAHCLRITVFSASKFPIKYLGVPITTRRLSKIECQGPIDKITTRIRGWTSRKLSFVGRTLLINTVIFELFTYWASVFILPNKILQKITQLSKDFLWGDSEEFKRVPHISWQ